MDRVSTYRELLPMYLKGKNIESHCNVIEKMTRALYSQIRILHDWNVLDRPIMVERDVTSTDLDPMSYGMVTYNIHINAQGPIKSIKVRNFYEEVYDVEDMVKNTVVSVVISIKSHLRVEVETYNDILYVKEYPENDTLQGDDADHDYYLDIVGAFLGIPRKNYIEYQVHEGNKAYPPYFGKQRYVKNYRMCYAPCTEDDYMYSSRLKQFLEDKKTSILNAFVKARYSKSIRVVTGDSILLEDLQHNFQDFVEEHNITQEWLDNNKYGLYVVYVSADDVPVNYKDAFSNEEIYLDINKFLPCTRLSLIRDMQPVEVKCKVIDVNTGFGSGARRNDATIQLIFDWPFLDFTYTVDGVEYNGRTDERGEAGFSVSSYNRADDFDIEISTTGVHGETPFRDSFTVHVVWYQIDTYKYVSVDEQTYTYSSILRPTSEEITSGYSQIIEEDYYD